MGMFLYFVFKNGVDPADHGAKNGRSLLGQQYRKRLEETEYIEKYQ